MMKLLSTFFIFFWSTTIFAHSALIVKTYDNKNCEEKNKPYQVFVLFGNDKDIDRCEEVSSYLLYSYSLNDGVCVHGITNPQKLCRKFAGETK